MSQATTTVAIGKAFGHILNPTRHSNQALDAAEHTRDAQG